MYNNHFAAVRQELSERNFTEGTTPSTQSCTVRLPGEPMGSPSKALNAKSYTQGEISANRKGVYFPQAPKEPPLSANKTPPCHGGVCSGNDTQADSTKTKKFVAFKDKKAACLKLCEFAAKTITLAALDIDVEGGEMYDGPHMTEKMLERIKSCSSWVEFATPEDFSKLKKIEGFVCKNAFCPVCAAYQSRRDGLKFSVMMDGMQAMKDVDVAKLYGEEVASLPSVKKAMSEGVEFVMLTLSSPNPKGDKLKAEEKLYAKAFDKLIKNWVARDYKDYYLGYARKLEVTYNKQKLITQEMWDGTGKYRKPMKWNFRRMGLKVGDRNPSYDTYNPHYHVILAVTPDFFYIAENGDECMKITPQMWLAKWKELLGNADITELDAQRVYKKRGEGNSAVSEIAKYVAKDADMLHSPKVFKIFYESLKGVKRITFGGLFAEAHKLFKDGKLDRYIPIDETVYKWAVHYEWAKSNYFEKVRRELSPEEAAKIAGMKYSEANDTEDF